MNNLKNFNMIIILLISFSREVTSEDYSLHRCDAPTQQSIFENLPQCMARPSLVDMRQHFADHHDVIQVCWLNQSTKYVMFMCCLQECIYIIKSFLNFDSSCKTKLITDLWFAGCSWSCDGGQMRRIMLHGVLQLHSWQHVTDQGTGHVGPVQVSTWEAWHHVQWGGGGGS